jgi:cytochrome c2
MRIPIGLLVFALLLAGCGTLATPIPAARSGDARRGEQLFIQREGTAPACSTCHHTLIGQTGFAVGPNLANIGGRAGSSVEGLTAEAYLRQSIVEPGRYLVPGYRDIMYADYGDHLTEREIRDLIAYLLTL